MTKPTPWRCYHCDEVFTDERSAREHFGINEFQMPGCIAKVNPGGERGLLAALRRSEKELADTLHALNEEDSATMRAMYEMQSRHAEALRIAEEAGYQRGIEDMRKELTPRRA